MAMLVAHNLQLRFIWPVRVVVSASELTRLDRCAPQCSEVKIWSTMDPKLWQTLLEPSQRSLFFSILSSIRVQLYPTVLVAWTGICQGSFINLRLTCKPSSLIPAAWKWETSMSFAAASILLLQQPRHQRYTQECKSERQSATNDQVSSSISGQPDSEF